MSTELTGRRFAIQVIDDDLGVGAITVGDFHETFVMDLSFWSAADYVSSWQRAMVQLETATDSTSCLISSVVDPKDGNFVVCWPLYRDGETVLVQNSIIFLDELERPFDPGKPWESVSPHCAVDEDGNHISEWPASMSRIRAFRGPAGHEQ